ncbi:PilZ domain-containing protein [Shewanella sp. OPT22]|nr:PilZ domain-containing protein [Shewanella sp. OPT22]
MNDRRKFSRVLFNAQAKIVQLPKLWKTQVLDISLNGALIQLPENFEINDSSYTLTLSLMDSNVEISMQTQVVYSGNNNIGLCCVEIDVDSMGHLKRLVELNSGSTDLLHRELPQFIREHAKLAYAC